MVTGHVDMTLPVGSEAVSSVMVVVHLAAAVKVAVLAVEVKVVTVERATAGTVVKLAVTAVLAFGNAVVKLVVAVLEDLLCLAGAREQHLVEYKMSVPDLPVRFQQNEQDLNEAEVVHLHICSHQVLGLRKGQEASVYLANVAMWPLGWLAAL